MKKEKKFLKRLIEKEFYKEENSFLNKKLKDLIKTAKYLGFKKLAKQMNDDLDIESAKFGEINLESLTIYKKNKNE